MQTPEIRRWDTIAIYLCVLPRLRYVMAQVIRHSDGGAILFRLFDLFLSGWKTDNWHKDTRAAQRHLREFAVAISTHTFVVDNAFKMLKHNAALHINSRQSQLPIYQF